MRFKYYLDPKSAVVYVIYQRCYETELCNLEGYHIRYIASVGSAWLVQKLTAYHQSHGQKLLAEHSFSMPMDNSFSVEAS